MALEVGSRLGHYHVTALIGEGGMGQVYQATDTKLNRQVALKILPEAFASDPDRLARFQREAQVLASLNHPGIAAIYGLEESGDTRALVLELVEGPTLADRISKGPIPLDEALPIAKQIAEALEAAHEAGVIHRDLKPANIKVRDDGTVKVLDFGLAKALDTTPQGDPSQSPTLTAAATQMGVIMGTAAYMSPEQARGKTVDKRADIWSFGVVLYEMLTGQRAFAGEDVSLTLSAVLQREPEWDASPTELPPTLVTYLRRCLQKDPRDRVRDIGDVRLAMAGAFDAVAAARTVDEEGGAWSRRVVAATLLSALTGATLSALIVWNLRPAQDAGQVSRFSMLLSPGDRLGDINQTLVDISPDGSVVVYVANDQLHLRSTNTRRSTPILGSEGAHAPFFSPDGRWVGFFQDGRLKKLSLPGQKIVTVANLDSRGGATWGADDTIVFQPGA